MMETLYGLQFDIDDSGHLGLTVSAREGAALAFIPHQRAMLLNNAFPRLLRLHIDSRNGVERCCYDISGKRKLFPSLAAQQPPQQLIYEIAHRLVATIADSSSLLLDESRYVLHEDYIFCGTRTTEFALCYLPLKEVVKPTLSQDLRLILLKLLTCAEHLNSEYVARICVELSKERIDVCALKETLKQVWLSFSEQAPQPVFAQDILANSKDADAEDAAGWLGLIANKSKWLWDVVRGAHSETVQAEPYPRANEHPLATVAEQVNVYAAHGADRTISFDQFIEDSRSYKLIIHHNGTNAEQSLPLDCDRFIVGRSRQGVHYTDASEGVSRVHCEFVRAEEAWDVRDLGSMNGTSLNGTKLVPFKSYRLEDGDIVKYVESEIKFVGL